MSLVWENKYFNKIKGISTYYNDNCDNNVDSSSFPTQGLGTSVVTGGATLVYNLNIKFDASCATEGNVNPDTTKPFFWNFLAKGLNLDIRQKTTDLLVKCGIEDFYNSYGKSIWNKKFILEKNKEIKVKIPTDLLKEDLNKEIIHGWVKLSKIAKKSGYRGTTRPQIQFVTNTASCTVHGQNVQMIKGGSHSFVLNSQSERQFLSFFNTSKKKINIELNLLQKNGDMSKLNTISLDSLSSTLYEVKLESMNIKRFESLTIIWSGSGSYKCHAIITDKQLERFSVDHQWNFLTSTQQL